MWISSLPCRIDLLLILLSAFALHAASRSVPQGVGLYDIIGTREPQSSCTCNDPCKLRDRWDIIRSCLVTVFTCTWVSIHPNVPSPTDGPWTLGFRRFQIMLTSLILPEWTITWAFSQWVTARKARKAHSNKGWTLTHGFFIQMGGFVLHDGENPRYPLTLKELEELHEAGEVDWPTISEKEIQDHSKSDWLTKAFVVLQTTWFVFQCIVRGIQRLGITELEIATLAFASLNGILYAFWWDKPFDVQCAVPVYVKTDASQEGSAAFKLLNKEWKDDEGIPDDTDQSQFRAKHLRVRTASLSALREDAIGAGVVVAIPLGAIHCIAWSFHFPSHAEQTLWRISSVGITVMPAVILVVVALESPLKSFAVGRILMQVLGWSVGVLIALFYPIARVILLVLPLIALRDLSPSMLAELDWSRYIPHF